MVRFFLFMVMVKQDDNRQCSAGAEQYVSTLCELPRENEHENVKLRFRLTQLHSETRGKGGLENR